MSDPTSPRALGPIYDDGTYKYYGEARPGTALAETKWRVSRMNIATKQVEWVAEGAASQVFTDLGTVAALTFA